MALDCGHARALVGHDAPQHGRRNPSAGGAKTRDATLLGDSLRGLLTRSDELLAAAAPHEALAGWLAAAVEHAMSYRGLVDALVDSLADPASDLHATCQAVKTAGAQLLDRAQQAGTIRRDVDASALFSLIAAVAWAAERTPEHRDPLLAVMLDGLGSGAGS